MAKYKIGDLQRIYGIFQPMAIQKCNPIFSFTVSKIIKALREEVELYNETMRKIQHQYGKLDEEGNIIADEGGKIQFDEGKEQECLEAMQEFLNGESDVNCPTIGLSQLANEGIKISSQEIEMIEDFLNIDI